MINQSIDPFFRRLFIVVAIVVGLVLLYLMMPVIVPFVFAFVLAYLFNPLVKRLSKYVKRWIAIIIVYSTITLSVALLLWWLVPTLWHQLQAAWEYLPKILTWYNQVLREWFDNNSPIRLPPLETKGFSETLLEYMQSHYRFEDASTLMSQVIASSMSFINSAGLIVLVPILTFYFLFNWDKRLNSWKMAIPAAYSKKVIDIAQECDRALMGFVKGQLLVMVLLGIIYAVQLQLIGLELGLIIGMGAGIASFVPYLGFGLGFIAAVIASLFQFGLDWFYLSLIVGAFLIGQAAEGYVLQPLLLGDKIGLSPLWVIFSVLAGASLLGFVGMLIALPVSAVLNVLFRHLYAHYQTTDSYKGHKQLNLFEKK
ncbi:putative PurR-regulated permease PerM [Psychrobacter sp. PL15]|jgi:predicted PurR-regulated permease PerM|uniref:AI-2E family transporter n=1 Tax=unclassified Psychrobacter TaxID=196806 RepID=UPI001AE924F5|nr:AI-2E family transporter [Psychrobacter sp. PL15]MEC5209024.1 putative PurR-regulated permease PerM [Psychrobacter sp. PL15]